MLFPTPPDTDRFPPPSFSIAGIDPLKGSATRTPCTSPEVIPVGNQTHATTGASQAMSVIPILVRPFAAEYILSEPSLRVLCSKNISWLPVPPAAFTSTADAASAAGEIPDRVLPPITLSLK